MLFAALFIFTFAVITQNRSNAMENLVKWLKRSVSPVFLVMLVASFILWYIAKLSYTYTTEQTVQVSVEGGEPFRLDCVVEGAGTHLFGYKAYMNKTLRIPLAELKYRAVETEEGEKRLAIDPQSLQNAVSVRFSDIKVVSIGAVPEIEEPVRITEKRKL